MAVDDVNPAALVPHDPAWAGSAAAALAVIGAALADLPGADGMELEHIGSTAVPGLAAKPFLDLQLRILPLPDEVALAPRLGPLGYERALGSRPDSPGVHRDVPRGTTTALAEVGAARAALGDVAREPGAPKPDAMLVADGVQRTFGGVHAVDVAHLEVQRHDEDVAPQVWQKSIWVHPDRAHILHVRRADSPWGMYTVWFRDWLRAHAEQRQRYERVKRGLSAQQVGKADYDDYTRAKSAFFDEVHDAFTSWGSATGR